MNDHGAVDSISHGLPHPHIFENRIARIERQIAEHRTGRLQHLQIGFVFQREDRVT
jgi:hypothetical protein